LPALRERRTKKGEKKGKKEKKKRAKMSPSPKYQGDRSGAMHDKKSSKLGMVSGVYIPVCLNIMSILMFLRFGLILGQVGFIGIVGMTQ